MIRPALGRAAAGAATGLARGLAAVDDVRAAAWRRRQGPAGVPCGDPPEAVLAVVAHWRPDAPEAARGRAELVERCVAGLLEIPARHVVAVVLTNNARQTARDLGERLRDGDGPPVRVAAPAALDAVPTAPREVLVVGWRPRLRHRHGFYLTWAHVPLLRRAARTGRFSHLVYLEDDMRFGAEHLRYWAEYRAPLAAAGLLPGFVRFERRGDERYLVDALRPLDPGPRRRELRIGDRSVGFVNLENPYQALYVLDRALFEPHFRFSRSRSPLRSRVSEWEVRERAAIGPIFDDVPAGLGSRNVVPVREGGGRLVVDPACLVEHMAPTHSSSGGPFGVVRLEELFAAPGAAP